MPTFMPVLPVCQRDDFRRRPAGYTRSRLAATFHPSEETMASNASRREFLLMCAVASGAPLASLDPRPAGAADVPKKGGTLRVGFYIEAATMDPHLSGSKIDRQVYHNIYEPLVTLDVKLNLKRPDAALLATLTDRAGMMVSPKVVQERGAELERNAKGAGTGPFEFVEWVKDDHLLIKRNESYWSKQGGPYLDRVRYRPIPDDTVKLQSLQTGEIDRSEEHTSELQSPYDLVCRLLLE